MIPVNYIRPTRWPSIHPFQQSIIRNQKSKQSARTDSVQFGMQGLQKELQNSLLREAAAGNVHRVRYLLTKKIDVNYANPYTGKTALMVAIENNQPDVVKALIQSRQLNLEKVDYDSRNAYMLAAKQGSIPCLKLLQGAQGKTNRVDREGLSALLIAAKNNQRDATVFLLTPGNINSKDFVGRTALFLAAQYGHHEILEELLHRHADMEIGNYDRVTPLMIAAQEGQIQIATTLIHAGANVNAVTRKQITPLMLAAQHNQLAILNRLLTWGALVNAVTNSLDSALILAAENGHASIVERLLEKGTDAGQINQDGYTALMQAARLGHRSTVEALMIRPADVLVNQADRHGLTALSYAIDRNALPIAQRLMDCPLVDLEKTDHAGNTPLLLAAKKNSLPMVAALLKKKVQINHANARGETALHHAAHLGNVAIVRLLLEHGALLNTINIDGATPLLLATQGRHSKVMNLLLKQEGIPPQRPHTRQFHQLQCYSDAVAAQANINRHQPFTDLLADLAAIDQFPMTELFWLAQSGTLDNLPWLLRDEAKRFANHRPMRQDQREQAWQNVMFLTRKGVEFDEAGIELALGFEARKPKPDEMDTREEIPNGPS